MAIAAGQQTIATLGPCVGKHRNGGSCSKHSHQRLLPARRCHTCAAQSECKRRMAADGLSSVSGEAALPSCSGVVAAKCQYDVTNSRLHCIWPSFLAEQTTFRESAARIGEASGYRHCLESAPSGLVCAQLGPGNAEKQKL